MYLCNFVQEQKLPPRMNENAFENELKRSIMDIVHARGEALVQCLHLTLDKLIGLMVRPPVIGGNIGTAPRPTPSADPHQLSLVLLILGSIYENTIFESKIRKNGK